MVCEVAKINEYVAQLSSNILWKCFAQKSLLMDCSKKKIRFTHFGKLNLLLLRKTQNYFYRLFDLLEAFFSAEN